MSRSIWKGPFNDRIQQTPRTQANQKQKKSFQVGQPPKIWSRRSQILPADAGKEFLVHNGRGFISVKCTEFMCSRKWGEFAVTRKKPSHKLNKRKQLHKKG